MPPTSSPPAAPVRIRLLNRQMGHHSVPVVLKGHSGRAYGSISHFSPADNCHAVEMTLEAYEAARADLFKAMRLHARRIWEVAVTLDDVKAKEQSDLPVPVAQFYLGFHDVMNGLVDPVNDSKGYLAGVKFAIDMVAESDDRPKGTTVTISTLPPPDASPQPEVNEQTPWNELQKIAKAEGVDLKLHKSKPALLKAVEARRSQPASES